MQRRSLLFLTCLLVVMAGIVPLSAAQAQDSRTVIQLSVPQFLKQIINDDMIAEFEAQNPNIKVNVLANDNNAGTAANDVDAMLEAEQAYASTADVLFVDNSTLAVQATRAGYFLDLSPLTSSDMTLNVEDFFPGVWQSFQWDNGIWALPVSTDVILMSYDPAAFDAIGLAYPNERWTMDDIANAARQLGVVDPTGAVTVSGLAISDNNLQWLFRSLLGKGFYDPNTLPNAPLLNDANLQAMMTTWQTLVSEGVVSNQGGFGAAESIPMTIGGSFTLAGPRFRPGDEDPNAVERQASLLPGGYAGLNAQGFAISSGTLYPEQAYALVKFLTNNPNVSRNFFGVRPARQSLVGVEPVQNNDPGENSGPVFAVAAFMNFSEAVNAVIDQAMTVGLPLSEIRYGDYVTTAIDKMTADSLDAQSALQTLEAQAVADLQAADTARTDNPVVLATPVPEVVLQPGEVALTFGLSSFIQPLPNQDKWDALIAEFTASDPQVKDIKLDTEMRGGDQMAEVTDCFYLSYNNVPGIDLSTVINLDPFIDSDPNFDKNDVIGQTLALITRDNKIWAYPLALQPSALEYNTDIFAQFNVPEPTAGWSISSFADALRSIKLDPSDPPPFVSREPGGNYLLQLMAAYGGLPLDYRTEPPTVDLTSPQNVEAIRQVLDLAKNGYLKYETLATNTFAISISQDSPDAIYTTVLNGFAFGGRRGGAVLATANVTVTDTVPNVKLTTYPTGTDYAAVSYDITTAYISATSQNPEGCYRWISFLSKHPEVLDAMPAFRSQLANAAVVQGQSAADFYTQMDNLLQQPNTLEFPSQFGGGFNSPANFLSQYWMNRAFDNYVLEDGDLEQGLTEAQTYIQAFQECTAGIPTFDPNTEDQGAFFEQYVECARKIDPSLDLFGAPGS